MFKKDGSVIRNPAAFVTHIVDYESHPIAGPMLLLPTYRDHNEDDVHTNISTIRTKTLFWKNQVRKIRTKAHIKLT